MNSYIVTVSPKGQITIPSKERKNAKSNKYLFEVKENAFILRPIEIKVIESDGKKDEMKNFSDLATSGFNFWDNKKDDIYQKFYSHQKKL